MLATLFMKPGDAEDAEDAEAAEAHWGRDERWVNTAWADRAEESLASRS